MKQYLAFISNRNYPTTGRPHPITGRYSIWGKLYAFATISERDEFCDTWNHYYNNYPVKTNWKHAKANYFAGMTQRDFEDVVRYLDNGGSI